MDTNELYDLAAKTYGTKLQLIVAIEEMAELQVELAKAVMHGSTDGDFCIRMEAVLNSATDVKSRCKRLRARKYGDVAKDINNKVDIVNETVDVEIMLEQIKKVFGMTHDSLAKPKHYKLQRLQERLEMSPLFK
jgi:hypothetical protein